MRGELTTVWPVDYRPRGGDVDVLGLRELPVDTPVGRAVLQYWLFRRADGGPHCEFVGAVIRALPAEQFRWLRDHLPLVDRALLQAVRDEWERLSSTRQ